MTKPLFGWMLPNGSTIEVAAWEHLAAVEEHKELQKVLKSDYEVMRDELRSIEDGCREDAKREGNVNAEWHRYEMARDDVGNKIVRLLYAKGCLRIGTVSHPQGDVLHFEGTPQAIKKLYRKCRDFAEDRNMQCSFDPREIQP